MTINQHNYEEFFLLYADGELSAAEKQAVDQFVAENPSLEAELVLFLEMKLDGDALVFEEKESLYRNIDHEITAHNQEAYFLLYVDNELNSETNNKVETYVLQHPASQELFTELKQTRLVPEAIVFPNKSVLYQKEKTEKPVFYIRLQRLVAAAVITGLAILAWNILPEKTSSLQSIALNNSANNITSKKPVINITNETNGGIVKDGTVTNKQSINNVSEGLIAVNEVAPNNSTMEGSNSIATIQINAPESVVKREDVVSIPLDKKTYSQSIPVSTNVLASASQELTNILEATEEHESIIQPTVYRELDTDDQNKSFYLGALEINKDKFRGIFRKAGSLFRSKSKPDEEKTETATPSNERSFK